MKKLLTAVLVVLGLGAALVGEGAWAASFRLGFENCPSGAHGQEGEVKDFDIILTLTSDVSESPDGASAWSFGIEVTGGRIVEHNPGELDGLATNGVIVSTIFTRRAGDPPIDPSPFDLRDADLNSSQTIPLGAVEATGAVSSIGLNLKAGEKRVLHPQGTVPIGKLKVRATVPSIVTLSYVGGLVGAGQPVPLVVALNGASITPSAETCCWGLTRDPEQPSGKVFVNLALAGTATQSSTRLGSEAGRAIDGNTDGDWAQRSVTHTELGDAAPWWQVDLGGTHALSRIILWNRTDCCSDRLSNFRVSVLDVSQVEVFGKDYFTNGVGSFSGSFPIDLPNNPKGRYVRVTLGRNSSDVMVLALAEVEVLAVGANMNGVIALKVPVGTVGNQEYTGTLGHDFDVVVPIVVTRLGVFDSAQDGLARTLSASIYNRDTQEQLAKLTFTTQSPGELVDGSRLKDLCRPLNLPARFHGTMVAEGYGPGEPNGNGNGGPVPWTTNSGSGAIAFTGTGRHGDDPGSYPVVSDTGPANRFAAGTFEFEGKPCPTAVDLQLVMQTANTRHVIGDPFATGNPPGLAPTPDPRYPAQVELAPGEGTVYAGIVSQLAGQGRGGVQGWSLALSVTGDIGLLEVTTEGTAGAPLPDGLQKGGFDIVEIVDPAIIHPDTGNPQGPGAVTAVVLSVHFPITLAEDSTATVLHIRVSGNEGDSGVVRWLDNMVGSGSPIRNVVTVNGESNGFGCAQAAEIRFVTPQVSTFVRGDASAQGQVNLSSGIFLLNFLFVGGPAPPCKDAADAADLGGLDISAAITIFNYLFLGGRTPPLPSPSTSNYRSDGLPDCGPDPTPDSLDCQSFPPCS